MVFVVSIKYGLDIVRFVISISAPDITQRDICQQFDIKRDIFVFLVIIHQQQKTRFLQVHLSV